MFQEWKHNNTGLCITSTFTCIMFLWYLFDLFSVFVGDDIAPSVLLHTSVPFSLENLETDKEEIKPVLLKHLQQVLPDLPEPVEVKSHKWRYSQVSLLFNKKNLWIYMQ